MIVICQFHWCVECVFQFIKLILIHHRIDVSFYYSLRAFHIHNDDTLKHI